MFKKVLVANRGEIAVRIIRALREMDIAAVAVFSEVDRASLHVQFADEAICIGPAPSTQSYLSVERILQAAQDTGAEAIHPGYGFLSENAAFAAACTRQGIKFIGPRSDAIQAMGSKTAARRLAIAAGAPVVPGTQQGVTTLADAREAAAGIGYPVLLKAAAGGGGKGMRRVDNERELASAVRGAADEAERAFGSGEVYLEKLILQPRHIEIQVLGDEYGHLIHLGERECSIQRRHQKVVEESPSPLMRQYPELRSQIGEAALQIARSVNYSNAGTMEFLVDGEGHFYFLEMNTRLQVEHPVTELVTGIDLVQWQLRIAAGEHLTLQQDEMRWTGSAVECRVYAEDPENNFFPAPGRIAHYVEPAGPGVRVDSGVYPGWNVPLDYDPLLAKLSVWAETRTQALRRMRRAVAEYQVLGTITNLPLFAQLLTDTEFVTGNLHTGFLDEFMHRRGKPQQSAGEPLLAAAVVAAIASNGNGSKPHRAEGRPSLWRELARRDTLR